MQKLVAALAGLIAAPALAQGGSPVIVQGGVPTAVVSYADLNLASVSGLTTLNGRVQRAASKMCFEDGRTDLATRLNWTRCYNAALASAKLQVDRAVADQVAHLALSGTVKVAAR